MRIPSFRHNKTDSVTEKPLPPPAPITTPDSHSSVSLSIHNRTSFEFLTHSHFGALHTGNGITQRVASSSLPSSPVVPQDGFTPTAIAAGGEFGVRNTPVRVAPGGRVNVPGVKIQAATAASTGGYEVGLTLTPRAKGLGGYSASLSAPPPAKVQEVGPVGRLWKPLELTPTSSAVKTANLSPNPSKPSAAVQGVIALQSTDPTTSTVHILLLPQRDLSTWMTSLPSTDPISSLCIPGTHESCALYGWPISACQESTSSIALQLSRGIRFLDVRLALKGTPGNQLLYAYHGVTDQKMEFSAILSQVYTFLTQNPGETVLMSVKQENNMPGFLDSVFTYINKNLPQWWLGTGMPMLGEARGKIVLISRFGSSSSQPGGIHPPIWPDSSPTPFSYTLPDGNNVVTQDWYNISSLSAIPQKLALITGLLNTTGTDPKVLGLNYTNGSSFPFALPPWVAKGTGDQSKAAQGGGWLSNIGVNALLVDLVAGRLQTVQTPRAGMMNIVAMDFFDQTGLGADLCSLLVQANFQ
ncbi:Phospholipase C, phosphatidylinositol-specific, X domain protein [Kalmanozyma brasiliensis GHG001]|uniref:Phosphatidylinositol-specific phospholipase C X domain-containing protein n=1 Tax=Kalmanozyma brasiliensis (strain GHG001) TaxID=1365824 RepID=V5EU49_KALBG|nr:Phospholipase C, phosphatidylinositol-specific, X domain protein [Kalmanozyma brasiliensis GHG001]EST08880.1 Phospholipase C, phosphatidylinositol-specific, X domain protein [Kalmanozyma brasiliensis GHG001]